jgi:hypothetical protein
MALRSVLVNRGSSKPLLVLETSSAEFEAGEAVPIPSEPEVVMVPEVFTLVTEVLPSLTVLFEAVAP